MNRNILTVIVFLFQQPLFAGSGLGVVLGFNEEKTTLSANDSRLNTAIQLTSIYQLKSRGKIYFGVDYLLTNSNQPVLNAISGNEKIISSSFFLTSKVVFGSREDLAFTAIYVPYSQLQKETPNLEIDLWSGNGYGAKLSFEPEISKTWRLSAAFNYVIINYSNKNQNTNLNSPSSFERSMWYPTIGLIYQLN
jgi:hypothetical protein